MSKIIKVIIIDNHPLMAEATKHLLEQIDGIQVVEIASSAKKGMELIELHHPNLVFLDYQLPDKAGTDAAKEIKAKFPGIHIVIFTGVDVSDMINDLLALQVSGVISKETSRSAIKSMIGVILEDHIVLPRSALHNIRLTNFSEDILLNQDEVIIMSMVVKGATLDQIGERIHISKRSVDNYQRKIYDKLGVETRAEAIEKFIRSHYYIDSKETK
jgi:two-component system competent response regulator ComA